MFHLVWEREGKKPTGTLVPDTMQEIHLASALTDAESPARDVLKLTEHRRAPLFWAQEFYNPPTPAPPNAIKQSWCHGFPIPSATWTPEPTLTSKLGFF